MLKETCAGNISVWFTQWWVCRGTYLVAHHIRIKFSVFNSRSCLQDNSSFSRWTEHVEREAKEQTETIDERTREYKWRSTHYEILRLLLNRWVHYHSNKIPPLNVGLIYIDPVQTIKTSNLMCKSIVYCPNIILIFVFPYRMSFL